MIIGREREKQLLTDILTSKEAEFVAVWGRRRIGKTFLIEGFFKEQRCIFFHTTGIQKGALSIQLREFIKEIGNIFYNGAKIAIPTTWMEAFESLHHAINQAPARISIVLFLDEFPWMSTPKSGLLQALEFYWNRYWKNNNRLKLIVCGSSASWIIKKIVYNKGGLHNRLTHKLHLKPFDLVNTKHFLYEHGLKLNNRQVLDMYCVTGGVPYYLKQINKKFSIIQNINKLCFQKEGLLYDEFSKVFSSLFKDSEVYEELIKLIAKNRHGISREEIEKNIKQTKKGGTLTCRLEDLEMAGFIKKFLPLAHSKKGLYYRIVDEYCLFYLQWIEPEKANIALDIEDNNFWSELVKTPQYLSWRGYAFESICYKHVAQIKKTLAIHDAEKIGTWRYTPRNNETEKGAQIDLLFERRDDAITLCEIKYTDSPFVLTKDYVTKIKAKEEIYRKITRTGNQIFIALISANGLKENKHSEEIIQAVVTLDDLIANDLEMNT